MTRNRHQKFFNPQKIGSPKRKATKTHNYLSHHPTGSDVICSACQDPIDDTNFIISQFGDFHFRPNQFCEICQKRICRTCWDTMKQCKTCYCHACIVCKQKRNPLLPYHVCNEKCQTRFPKFYGERLEQILFHENKPTGKYSATTSITTIIMNYVGLPPMDNPIKMRFVY